MDRTSDVVDTVATAINEAYDGSPAEIALAVLEAIRSAGYVVVPREPTYAMRLAGPPRLGEILTYRDMGDLWKAMIAAAEGGE